MNLLSQTAALMFLARLRPEVIDALKPHTPLISEKVRNIYASSVIKSIAQKVTDANVAKELHSVGKSLFEDGSKAITYDDNFWPWPNPKPYYLDEIIKFGPSPQPWAFSVGGEEVMLNPQPLPPREQPYYGAILTMLADAVSLKEISENLRNIGAGLMKQTAENAGNNYS